MRGLVILGALALLSGCVTSDGQPYDLGARMAKASKALKDPQPTPSVVIIRE